MMVALLRVTPSRRMFRRKSGNLSTSGLSRFPVKANIYPAELSTFVFVKYFYKYEGFHTFERIFTLIWVP